MGQVSTTDIILFIGGVFYGIVLLLSGFINNRIVENFRLDTFFTTKPTPQTKILNIFFGLIVIALSIYSFIGFYK
jgi:hypothetical protein